MTTLEWAAVSLLAAIVLLALAARSAENQASQSRFPLWGTGFAVGFALASVVLFGWTLARWLL